jgi:hypothetical protein
MRDVYLPPGTPATSALVREVAERHARLARGRGTPADVSALLEACVVAVVARRAALSPEQLSFASAALDVGWRGEPRRECNDAKHAARARAAAGAAESAAAAAAEAHPALAARARGERSALECVAAFAAAFARHAASAAQLMFLVTAAAGDVDTSCEAALCGGALAVGVRAALAACVAAGHDGEDDESGEGAAVGAARAALEPRRLDERAPLNWLLRHGGLCRGGAGESPLPAMTLLLMRGMQRSDARAAALRNDDDADADALPLLLPPPLAAPLSPHAVARCDAVTRLARLAAALRAPRAALHAAPLALPPAELPPPPPLRIHVPAMRDAAVIHLQHGCALLSHAAAGGAVLPCATAAWVSGLSETELYALVDATTVLTCGALSNVAVMHLARAMAAAQRGAQMQQALQLARASGGGGVGAA